MLLSESVSKIPIQEFQAVFGSTLPYSSFICHKLTFNSLKKSLASQTESKHHKISKPGSSQNLKYKLLKRALLKKPRIFSSL